jgi:hypothetical protein
MNFESIHAPTPAPVNVPKLTTAIRLVELSISVWSGRKQDKNATRDAAIASNADKTLLNTTKKLLGDCEELEAVRKFAANARNFVYSSTSPWGDLGQRSFPMSKFPDFHREITGMQTEFDRLVTNFLAVYDYARTNVQAKLGALYNPDEYPTPASLQDKFRFFFTYPPVPEANMYSQVQDEAEAYLRDEYARVYTDRINGMMKDVWERVYDALKHMSERLDYPENADKGTRKIFRDTLVDNVRESLGMLKDFNITGDSRLTQLHMQLDSALMGVTADGLREDDSFRQETKRTVDSILSNMSW